MVRSSSLIGSWLSAVSPIPIREHLFRIGLRDYQRDILRQVEAYMRLGVKRILVVLPTGGGKTVLAAAMMQSVMAAQMRAEFIVHRDSLLRQTSNSFLEKGIPHGFIAAGYPEDYTSPVELCGIATLANRMDLILPPNLAILDECHHAVSATWARTIEALGDTFIVGLTATPQRLDGRGLGDIFDVMIEGPTTAELIERGYLSDFDYFAPHIPEVQGKSDRAYAELLNTPRLVGDVVEHYQRLAYGLPGMIFAGSIDHSKELASAFCTSGIIAAHIDGTMHRDHLREIDDALRLKQIDIITNVELCGEGYDVPDLVYCGIARVTNSLSWQRQMCGRVLRLKEHKAIIADHAGNALRGLGLPTSNVRWSLDSTSRKSGNGCNVDSDPIHQCPECYLVTYSTVSVCPRCGHTFAVQSRTVKTVKGTLCKIEQAQLKAEAQEKRKREERACKSRHDLEELARARGYRDPAGWAWVQAKIRRWV